jgi:hypothetical protein
MSCGELEPETRRRLQFCQDDRVDKCILEIEN